MSSIAAESNAVNEVATPTRPRRWQLKQLLGRLAKPMVHAFKLVDNQPETVPSERENAVEEVQFAAPKAVQQVLDDDSYTGRHEIPLYFIEFDVNGRRVFADTPFDEEGAGGFAWAAELQRREPEIYCYRLPARLVQQAEPVPYEEWSKWYDGDDAPDLDKLSTVQHAIHTQFTDELNKLDCVFSSLDRIGLFAKWVMVQYEAIAKEFGVPLREEPESIIEDLCSGNTVINDKKAYEQLDLPMPCAED